MIKMVLLRHGESEWNKENRFTGWTDVDLSGRGLLKRRMAAGCCARVAIRSTWLTRRC